MTDLNDLFKLVAEGKKKYEETDPKGKIIKQVKQNVKEDLSAIFDQLSALTTLKEELQQELVVEEAKLIEQPIVEEVLTEVDIPEVKPASQIHSQAEIDKYLKRDASFQQPDPDVVGKNVDEIRNKIKFLEQAIGRIAATGPGSGEVNLRWLDDVDRSTIDDNHYLKYNASKKKFDFVEIPENFSLVTGEPMGHKDLNESSISFNNSTRTFSISPKLDSFTVYVRGVKFIITDTRTVTIPNTTGLYYIYFDVNGILQYKTTFFDFEHEAMTSYVYWNSSTNSAPFVADERHGIVMDWQTHEYQHRTRGAAIASGFTASNYTVTGDGSSNTHIQINLSSGTFFDEDLQVDIVHSDTPIPNTWQQDLNRIPMFYHIDSAWVIDAPTDFPVKQGTQRARYNSLVGGVWSTADLQNNKFGVTILLATNNINYPVIGILGQSTYNTIGQAQTVDYNDLNLTGFPVVELRPLYRLIYQVKDSFTNTPKAALVEVKDIRKDLSIQVV